MSWAAPIRHRSSATDRSVIEKRVWKSSPSRFRKATSSFRTVSPRATRSLIRRRCSGSSHSSEIGSGPPRTSSSLSKPNSSTKARFTRRNSWVSGSWRVKATGVISKMPSSRSRARSSSFRVRIRSVTSRTTAWTRTWPSVSTREAEISPTQVVPSGRSKGSSKRPKPSSFTRRTASRASGRASSGWRSRTVRPTSSSSG